MHTCNGGKDNIPDFEQCGVKAVTELAFMKGVNDNKYEVYRF